MPGPSPESPATALRVQVCQLLPGDTMRGSRETVESVSAGIATPRGKMEITLRVKSRPIATPSRD